MRRSPFLHAAELSSSFGNGLLWSDSLSGWALIEQVAPSGDGRNVGAVVGEDLLEDVRGVVSGSSVTTGAVFVGSAAGGADVEAAVAWWRR